MMTQTWRGLAEETEETAASAAALLRGRSRRLLADLLRGDRGRVVQDGPPGRLLAAGEGRFARMHQSWQAGLA